jgi:hypothetical protein
MKWETLNAFRTINEFNTAQEKKLLPFVGSASYFWLFKLPLKYRNKGRHLSEKYSAQKMLQVTRKCAEREKAKAAFPRCQSRGGVGWGGG